jgi:hypothetical protein
MPTTTSGPLLSFPPSAHSLSLSLQIQPGVSRIPQGLHLLLPAQQFDSSSPLSPLSALLDILPLRFPLSSLAVAPEISDEAVDTLVEVSLSLLPPLLPSLCDCVRAICR